MKEGLPAIEERVSTIEDRLAGICESCGSSAPPVITHDAPDSSSNFEEEITFTLSDDVELSHFILQGDASPYIQLTEYFKPGVQNIAITHTIGLPNEINEILAIVVDTDGNASKTLIVIEFDAPQCANGETRTCGECESGTSTCSGGVWGLCTGEVSTDIDPENCGACGIDCTVDPGIIEEACNDGSCQYVCDSQHANCTDAPGCETDITTVTNCGECGNMCAAGEVCSNEGDCGPSGIL